MRNLLCATVVALVAMLLVLPVQAGEVSPNQAVGTVSCPSCGKTDDVSSIGAVLPQGETEEIQPIEENTWSGNPDDPVYGSGWLDIYMCVAGYWDESCKHILYHTNWLD